MGIVYKAHDERLGRHVALKLLPPHLSTQAAPKERFLVEARAAATLDHPNICTISGDWGDPTTDSCSSRCRCTTARRVRSAIAAGPAVLRGSLGIAGPDCARRRQRPRARRRAPRHQAVQHHGAVETVTVKVLDFGIAHEQEDWVAGPARRRFGTLAYMSPEHVKGAAINHRSDIWSLGVLIHEMLTGVRPFPDSDPSDISKAILHARSRLIATAHPDVPDGIDQVLRRALAKRPEDRYASMAALAADLAALAPAGDGASREEALARAAVRPRPTKPPSPSVAVRRCW